MKKSLLALGFNVLFFVLIATLIHTASNTLPIDVVASSVSVSSPSN